MDGMGSDSWQDLVPVVVSRNRFGFEFKDDDVDGSGGRVMVLWIVLAFFMGLLMARSIYLHVFDNEKNRLLAKSNSIKLDRQFAPRGIIYDRNGVPLVENVKSERYGFVRKYVLGEAGAHVVGYVDEVREDEVGCREGLCYMQGMLIGRSGVERVMESVLRGVDGGEIWEVDALGNKVRKIGYQKYEKGRDVYLSIDRDLQMIAYDALKKKLGADGSGSVVVLDINGGVLALVSYPSFDANIFTVSRDPDEISRLLSDRKREYFLDRAISGAYPPGSVFKLVTAYAGLEEGKIDGDTKIKDVGELKVNGYRYGNWYFDKYGKTEGDIDVVEALKRSNDIFFYKVGEMVGINDLVKWSKRFGLGEKTGIELGGESVGLVPTPLWKERVVGERWFLGNTYHMSIGQGDLLTTPIQVARMTLASISGRLCRVSLIKDGGVDCEDMGLNTDNIDIVREGMKEACASGGTAFPFFEFKPWVICKTGTAQSGGEKDKPHAWIAVGYPGENPEFVMVVMLENAGEGSYEAGPVAKEILERYKEVLSGRK